jgi:glycosyltransferase involved in cell wall biosynthesis
VVIEEQAAFPTPGRAALTQAGIDVHVAPRAGEADPLVTARDVARYVDRAAPAAVLFWNVIAEHKILIADLLFETPIWDVSPGEMYYASLDRYFARPRVGVPYLRGSDYGRLLAGAIVKVESEKARAEATLGIPAFVVPNGVPTTRTPTRRTTRAQLVIGTLARLSPDKKLEELIDAPLPDGVALVIAGGPERGSEAYERELRARAAARGGLIELAGERDATAFLESIDIFAMVSEPAGCPNATLEAMAVGLPIVATDHGGAREQIVDGESGLVVPRGDPAALGAALARLAGDVELRARLGDAAHARAKSHFDLSRMVASYLRLCLGVGPPRLAVAGHRAPAEDAGSSPSF